MFLAESKLLKQTVNKQYHQMQITLKLMNNHLHALEKDVAFLSSLDVMDEVLSDDIDKKISRLLEKKAKDIGKNTTLFFIDEKKHIISSSNAALLMQNFSPPFTLDKKGYFLQDKKLYIYSQVLASFDPDKKLGFLMLAYNLDNLKLFLTDTKSIHTYIVNAAHTVSIGRDLHLHINFNQKSHSEITDKYVMVYKKIDFFKKPWYLIYAVDKATALESLYDFVKFILAMSLFIMLVVLYIAYKRSKEIIKPIEELTNITNEITRTHNYTKEIKSSSTDEIQILTEAFNSMLKTTSTALLELEEESKRRLTQFIDLINLFNTIIQTQHESDCIESSIEQIRLLTKNQNLHFQRHKTSEKDTLSIDLYVSDFQNNKKQYYGTILLGFESFYDENEKRFYDSIAAMITLQLERIRLIENTMSVSKAKSAFISNMSHELRTPLNAIISATQLMIAYEELSDEQQDSIANIESSAHYLLEMINGILDITKIEAGKMEVYLTRVDIIELLKNSLDILMPLIHDKDLKFHFQTNNIQRVQITTDIKIFQQIIINLLSNAIKFTDKGSIELTVKENEDSIFITITDTGIGIAKEDIKLLFSDFTQLENIMQKQHKGTGLGLSLSRKMAKLLGGDIEMKSEGLGEGTTITFSLKKS